MPCDIGVKAGVPIPPNDTDVGSFRITDLNRRQPWYKQGLIDGIHEHVDDGDHVSVVGLGRGVSTTHAVRAGSHVTAYEATAEMIESAEQTLAWQGIRDRVDIVHGVVGDPLNTYGSELGTVVPPSDAADCDVLVMDCEGAELSILHQTTTWPDTIIVEAHPPQGTPADGLRRLLEWGGHHVTAREYQPNEDDPQKQVLVAQR